MQINKSEYRKINKLSASDIKLFEKDRNKFYRTKVLGERQEWINIEFFKTKQEAIDFVKEHFGADENGMVCLVSAI